MNDDEELPTEEQVNVAIIWLEAHAKDLQKQFSNPGQHTTNDCDYLGCGKIKLRGRGSGAGWHEIGYVSELATYKALMSLPGPLRGGWEWKQGKRCN